MHGGYAGVPDDDLLRIPYARLLQAVRIASEHAVDAARERYRHAAFIGWQVRTAVGLGGSRSPAFGQYLRQLGLHEERAPAASRARVTDRVALVREAFQRGRMRKTAD